MADYGLFNDLAPGGAPTAPPAVVDESKDYGLFNDLVPQPRGNIAEMGRALARGAISGAGQALSGPATLVGAPESGVAKTGVAISQYGERAFAPTAGRETQLINQVPAFLGGVGPAAAAGLAASAVGSPLAGAAVTAGLLGAQTAGGEAAAAKAAGATPEQQQAAAAGGAATGAALGLIPGGMLTRGAARVLPTLAERGLVGGAARTAAAAAEGAGIGAGGQATSNLIAGQTYDPNRNIGAGVPEAAGVTALGMGLLHPILGAGAPRRPAEPTPPGAPEPPQLMLPRPAAIPMYGPGGAPSPPALALPPPRPLGVADRAAIARTTSDAGVDVLGPRTAEANQFVVQHPSAERLSPALLDPLAQMAADANAAGYNISINSGHRTTEHQQELYAADVAKNGGKPSGMVAPPGHSQHELGMAADLAYGPGAQRWVHDHAADYGLHFPMSYEPWHVEPMGGRDRNMPRAVGGIEPDAALLALMPPQRLLPPPATTYGDNFTMRDTDPGAATPAAPPSAVAPVISPMDRALQAVSQLNPGDPVTRRLLSQLSGFKSQEQIATLRDRMVRQGLVLSANGRYTRAATVNPPDVFALPTVTPGAPPLSNHLAAYQANQARVARDAAIVAAGGEPTTIPPPYVPPIAPPAAAPASAPEVPRPAIDIAPHPPQPEPLPRDVAPIPLENRGTASSQWQATDLGPPALDPRVSRVNQRAGTTAELNASLNRADATRNQPRLSPDQVAVAEGARTEMARRFDDAASEAQGETALSDWRAAAQNYAENIYRGAGKRDAREGLLKSIEQGGTTTQSQRWVQDNPRPDVGTVEVRVPHGRGGETVLTIPRDERIIRRVADQYGKLPPDALYQRPAEGLPPVPAHGVDRDALRGELYRIAKERAPTLRLSTMAELIGTIEGRPSAIHGSYHTEERPGGVLEHIASVALGGPEPKAALSHELVHFFRRAGLFTRPEWEILSGRADKWADQFKVNERYADQSLGVRREEAVAEAYAAWDKGALPLPPGLRRIFGNVKQFFDRVGNWLRGRGYQTAEDVFGRMTSGEVGGRGLGEQIGGTRYHRAYHGSPHDFDQFDASKIGTGEGAQAYGHGLYFAGNKSIAEFYRQKLAEEKYVTPAGQIWSPDALEHLNVRATARRNGIDLDATIGRAESLLLGANDQTRPMLKRDIEQLRALKAQGGIQAEKGRLYHVELAPAEDEYLDWDKPLSQQSEKVRAALKEITDRLPDRGDGWSGHMIYQNLAREMGGERMLGPPNARYSTRFANDEAASAALREAGIPGIRYLDQGSRGTGDGSHNYVIFDPSHISIESKYQRPMPPEDERVRTALNQIRVAPDSRPIWQRATDMLQSVKERVLAEGRYATVDSFDPILKMEKAGNEGKRRDASLSAFVAAHMSRELPAVMGRTVGIPDRQGGFLGGVPMMRNGAVVINPDSKPLMDAFKSVFAANRQNAFELWWAINRGKRLITEGRERLITPELIAEHRNDHLRPENLGPNGENLFLDAQRAWTKFNRHVLDFGEQTGIIDPEARALFEKGDYVPFFRRIGVEDNPLGPGRGARGIANQNSGIRQLLGGTEKLNSLYENAYLVTEAMISRGLKNEAAIRTRDEAAPQGLLERVSLAEQMASKGKRGDNIVSIMDKGKHEYYRVTQPLLYKAITAFGPVETSAVVKLLALPKRLLTGAVTHEPTFMFANLTRDTMQTYVLSANTGFKPGLDTAKGALSALRNSPDAVNLMVGSHFYGNSPTAWIRHLSEGDTWNPLHTPRHLWEALERVGSASEQANRIGLKNAALQKGATEAEAIWQAKDILNFTAQGGSELMKFLVQTVPFMNARVQGLDRLQRGVRESPTSFMTRGGMIMAAGLALWEMNKDNPDYQRLPDYEKQAYTHLFLPNGYSIRIPNPFEVGAIFLAAPQMLADYVDNGNHHQLWNAFTANLAQQLNMDPIPQALAPAYDVERNVNSLTGAPIVNESEKNLTPGERFGPATSSTMTAIGQELNLSPAQLEYLFKGYGGTLGSYLLAATDALTNAASDKVRPEMRVEQMPFIGRFVHSQPALTNRWVNGFYDVKTEVDQLHSTMNAMVKEGRVAEAQQLVQDNLEKLGVHAQTTTIGQQLAAVRAAMRQINDAPNLSSAEKRVQLDNLIATRNRIGDIAGRQITETMRP